MDKICKEYIFPILISAVTLMTQQAWGQRDTTNINATAMDKLVILPHQKLDIKASATSSAIDFDFFSGNWTLTNRKLKDRLEQSNEWLDFPANQTVWKILLGNGNADTYTAIINGKPFEGMTLRLFDPKTRLWSIYWADSNHGILDNPVIGSFDGDIANFYTRDSFKGKSIIVKFNWDKTDPDHPIWSQAFSEDEGKTWEWNWYMQFSRPSAMVVKPRTDQRIKVMELRNYQLVPGKQAEFTAFFDRNFVKAQENLGGYIIGEYKVKYMDDRFFWMRGFEDMQSRSVYLPAFYYNSTSWRTNRNEANSMLVDNDNVLLIRPLNDAKTSEDPNIGTSREALGSASDLIVADYYYTKDNGLDPLIGFFQSQYKPFLKSLQIDNVSLWISEMATNDFPRLPVIQNKNLLVVLSHYKDEQQYQEKLKRQDAYSISSGLTGLFNRKETLILIPR